MSDPDNAERKKKYLSLKHCVWIASFEWLLDLQVLPFVLAYIVLLPWRFLELKALAVAQYSEVPSNSQNVQKMKHVARNLNRKELPKRAQVISNLFKFLVKDYLTLLIIAVLLATLWRALNTLEILYDYAQRYKKGNSFLLDYKLKDISLQKRIAREFRYLLRDLLMLLVMIMTLAMVHRAGRLLGRLKGVGVKRKERKEMQTLEYFKKFKMLRSVTASR